VLPPAFHAVTAIALLSVMDAIIKALVVRLPVIEVTFGRYLVGSLAMAVIVAIRRPGWPTREAVRANSARAVVVVVTATSFFYGLGQLPLAEALILSFISPAVTALFAALILRERAGPRVLLALAVGFAGMALIVLFGLPGSTGGSARSGSLTGVAAILVSAVGYSLSNVLLRARAQRDAVLTIVAIQNVAPCLILLGPAAWVAVAPSGADLILLVVVGGLGVAGHLLLARAYARAEATRLAALDYTALIWAVLIGALAFGEMPAGVTWLGAALILLTALISTRR
jgi:S-adenosylmethionine uptake transporter